MADDKQGLPFRVYESVLGRVKKLVDTGSDVAKANIRRDGAPRSAGTPERQETGTSVATSEQSEESAETLSTPAVGETATATSALATALDEEAKAAIAKHAGADAEVTDGLAIKDQSGRVPPDEELGPEPFTPQVGP